MMFRELPGPGVAKGSPLGITSRPPFAAETERKPLSSISADTFTCPAQAPIPCDGIASEANGERGETYLPGRKISVTRSLKYGVRSTGSVRVVAESGVFQSTGDIGGRGAAVSTGGSFC